MADSHGPRPPLEPRPDHVEPIYMYHPARKGTLLLGRCQKVIEKGEERLGIRRWFILDACLVVTGKGFLSSTPESTGRIDLDENGFLTARTYWFFLSDVAAHLDYAVTVCMQQHFGMGAPCSAGGTTTMACTNLTGPQRIHTLSLHLATSTSCSQVPMDIVQYPD